MTLIGWTLLLVASAAALAAASFAYLRREPAIPGRGLLLALRSAALVLLVLILIGPAIPRLLSTGERAPRLVLMDRSLSMLLPAASGAAGSRWERALELAVDAGPERLLLFGEEVTAHHDFAADSLAPVATGSRLLPAVRAAIEAGAGSVTVITDGALEDAAAAGRAAAGAGLPLEVRRVGSELGNLAMTEVELPGWAPEGGAVELVARVEATGVVSAESVGVVVRAGDRLLAEERIAVAGPGRLSSATLRFAAPSPPAGEELVRLDVRLTSSDPVPDDDVRTVYLRVAERPADAVLVSFSPDWEPRFLLPVIERATGLPTRGFLAAGERFLALGPGESAVGGAAEAEVRAALSGAELVILHGYGPDAPGWAREAARGARAVLVLAGGASGALPGVPVELGAALEGDWYVEGATPPSPLAALLGGLPVDSLPPLPSLRPAVSGDGRWAALLARRGRRGEQVAVLVGGERAAGRWAVATGSGYWRWGFRPGPSRAGYRQLWSAVGGWLVSGERMVGGEAVRPVRRAVARGETITWSIAPALRADSLAIGLVLEEAHGFRPLGTDDSRESGMELVFGFVPRGDSAVVASPPPGHYRYHVVALRDGAAVDSAAGPLTVESYAREFSRPSADSPVGAVDGGGRSRAVGPALPLHARGWPYLLLAGLLCLEWTLRRRWGLR